MSVDTEFVKNLGFDGCFGAEAAGYTAPMAEDEAVPTHTAAAEDESLLERLRGMPVGVEDPTIVGDVGPADVPPGPDPVAPDDGTGSSTVGPVPPAP